MTRILALRVLWVCVWALLQGSSTTRVQAWEEQETSADSDPALAADPVSEPAEGKELSGDLTDLSLEELTNLKIDTVTGAARYAQPVSRAASSVTILTADDLRKFGYRTLGDALQGVRGMHVSYDRLYQYLGVRGLGRTGDYNTRFLLLVNGQRINDSLTDAAPIGTEFPIDLALIERIEIIRGPGSAVYGSNAFLAVINVITKGAHQLETVEVSGRAASFDTYAGRATYGKTFENGLALLLSASGLHSAGPSLYFGEFDSPATNNGNVRSQDALQSYSLFLQAAWKSLTFEAAFLRRLKEIPTAAYETIFNDPAADVTTERAYVSLKLEREIADAWKLAARIHYDHFYERGRYPTDFTADGGPPRALNVDLFRNGLWGVEAFVKTEVIPRNNLVAGFELNHAFLLEQRNFDLAENLDDKRHSLRLGLYAQDEVKILDNLSFTGGIRFDHYEHVGSSVNPRLAAIYSPWQPTAFKLLYGTAFRAPIAYELYYGDGGSTQKGNPDLDPESMESLELVFEQYLHQTTHLTLSAYRYEVTDLISQETDPADGLIVFTNRGHLDGAGIELELETRLQSGLRWRIGYSAQAVSLRKPSARPENSPQHLVRANIVIPLYRDQLFLGLEGQYMSRRRTLNGDFAEDHAIFNATLFGTELLPGLDVSASIYNLFGQKYGDPGHDGLAQDTIRQDGRSFSFQLTWRLR